MSDTVGRHTGPSRRPRQQGFAVPATVPATEPVTELVTGLSTVALGHPDLILALPRPEGRPRRTGDSVLLRDGCGLHHEAVVAGLAKAGSLPVYLLVVRRLLGPAGPTRERHLVVVADPDDAAEVADVVSLRPRH